MADPTDRHVRAKLHPIDRSGIALRSHCFLIEILQVRAQRLDDEALLVQDCPLQSLTDLPGRIGIDAYPPQGVRERGVVIRTIDVTVRQSTAAAPA